MERVLSLAAGVHPDLAPDDMVATAAAAGWSACGVWFDPATWSPRTTAAVRERLDDTGLLALDLEPIIPAEGHDDHGERIIETAAEIGARHVLFTSRLPELAATIERFDTLCAVAQQYDVSLVCEFLPIFPLSTLATARDVVANTPAANAGILVDNLHLSRSGGTVSDLHTIERARLPYIQIADAPHQPPADIAGLLDEAVNGRLLPGDGGLPIDELLRAVPDVPLSFEVRSQELRDGFSDPVERARYVLAAVRHLAER